MNPIISIINGLIDAMNKIPGVDLGKVGKIGGGNAPAPQVPALQHGGIVRRPTFALLGERGPEAVVPLPAGMAGGMGHPSITVVNHFHGLTVRDESDIEAIANRTRGSLEGIR